jgi:hypothetical protein
VTTCIDEPQPTTSRAKRESFVVFMGQLLAGLAGSGVRRRLGFQPLAASHFGLA